MEVKHSETVSGRLRRWVRESEKENRYPTTIAIEEATGDRSYSCREEHELFLALADEIDREKDAIVEAQGGYHASPHRIMKT